MAEAAGGTPAAGPTRKRKTRWGPPVGVESPSCHTETKKEKKFSSDTPTKLLIRILLAHPKAGVGGNGVDSFKDKITMWYEEACENVVGRPARNCRIRQLEKKANYCEEVQERKRKNDELAAYHMDLIAKHEAAADCVGRVLPARVTMIARPPTPPTPPADVEEAIAVSAVYTRPVAAV